ncbi:electron transport complex, RnfABCDGE type, E subunit [Alkaliphilus metalliredigens QYMF]|uniref:Ion-translocating oxidoreductase complex subunit E n=1 Tax=Alkaliphilus metalliredigens (strain QYMF) TaxID=293826 RepID=A6TQH2_ALKMQ|nr:electron transport complex subunit E [Alkaliphilus metalliredigens]ABR48440.1 electron transport complex, RnfABCDGE type, E subunit [Alkaliphilus metalliredigens QYMF]
MNVKEIVRRGIISENPIFVQFLGMCPVLAVTNTAENALGMGLATTAVLLGSNTVISAVKNFIPSKIRIPSYIVIIATFVTMIGMLMNAYVPALFASLGIFMPLIVVNCLILGRAESFASKNNTGKSVVDGVSMGLGFTLSLVILGAVRELLGAGTIFNMAIMAESYKPAGIMIQPPGAFLALGLLVAMFKVIGKMVQASKDKKTEIRGA